MSRDHKSFPALKGCIHTDGRPCDNSLWFKPHLEADSPKTRSSEPTAACELYCCHRCSHSAVSSLTALYVCSSLLLPPQPVHLVQWHSER
jgi:hypothetical protein